MYLRQNDGLTLADLRDSLALAMETHGAVCASPPVFVVTNVRISGSIAGAHPHIDGRYIAPYVAVQRLWSTRRCVLSIQRQTGLL